MGITIPACEMFRLQASRGMTVVGCLKHDVVCWLLEREAWTCPTCGYHPPPWAPPFVVTAIDHRAGTITLD